MTDETVMRMPANGSSPAANEQSGSVQAPLPRPTPTPPQELTGRPMVTLGEETLTLTLDFPRLQQLDELMTGGSVMAHLEGGVNMKAIDQGAVLFVAVPGRFRSPAEAARLIYEHRAAFTIRGAIADLLAYHYLPDEILDEVVGIRPGRSAGDSAAGGDSVAEGNS